MANQYNPQQIEPKWQTLWAETGLYHAPDADPRPKYYLLTEFPYPSGAGLHTGHVREYAAADALARLRRMQGHNVLYPIGWDAFGLPTENFAIKNKITPQAATANNVAIMRSQLKSLGMSFDWDREISTADPAYYRWTQWLFLQFLKAGLAYQDEIAINWCPKCKTGLANEEVVAGKHERCGTTVEKKLLKQWLMRITAYADRLIDDLKTVDYLPRIADQQVNWIGRSEGAEIDFTVDSQTITVYTTRPDTLAGATFLVLAPEHPAVKAITTPEHRTHVMAYVKDAQAKSDVDRQETGRAKTGVFTGAHTTNPLTGDQMPVWVADYVLNNYGTGAIMAVPAHDQRDFDFAQAFDLPIKSVVAMEFGQELPDEQWVDGVSVITYSQSTGKVLGLDWATGGWTWIVSGSIEKGETYEDCARRELAEEGGVRNVKQLIPLGDPVFAHYSDTAKKSNRYCKTQGFLALVDDEILHDNKLEEHEKFIPHWYSPQELRKKITRLEHATHWVELLDRADKQIASGVSSPMTYGPYTGCGPLINSGQFDRLKNTEAQKAIVANLYDQGVARGATRYKLRDWVFSRQHYWGEPIPIVHCDVCRHSVMEGATELSFYDQGTWDRLTTGRKTVETRAIDPDRHFDQIKAGDYLKAVNRNTKEEAYFKVTAQRVYKKFDDFLADKPMLEGAYGGYEGRFPQTTADLEEDYSYTPDYIERIKNHGLVAWQIERVLPGVVPVPEDQLPVELPIVESYEPTDTGKSPLSAIPEWVNTTCPDCGGPAQRETDTMPNWAGSSWYFLRYADPHNNQAFADRAKLDYWTPVSLYIGGMEHTTLHLLYSRFWHKFFYDRGLVPTPEPYAARRAQGMVLAADGRKMSKSWGNVVNPTEVVEHYGADTLRLYEMFMAPFDESTPWSEERLAGISRFLHRVWNLAQDLMPTASARPAATDMTPGEIATAIDRVTHQTIQKVTHDIENLRFNTAISSLMEYLNALTEAKSKTILMDPSSVALAHRTLRALLLLLAPLAPHLAEELWHQLGEGESIHVQPWPQYDPALIKEDVVQIPVQVAGKLRATILAPVDTPEQELIAQAQSEPNVSRHLEGKAIAKTIVIPRKLINFVVK